VFTLVGQLHHSHFVPWPLLYRTFYRITLVNIAVHCVFRTGCNRSHTYLSGLLQILMNVKQVASTQVSRHICVDQRLWLLVMSQLVIIVPMTNACAGGV